LMQSEKYTHNDLKFLVKHRVIYYGKAVSSTSSICRSFSGLKQI
jgi:hypothetical protein